MKGKILLGLTAILMLTGAAVPVKADDVWKFDAQRFVLKEYTGTETDVVVPDTMDEGVPVKRLGTQLLAGSETLTSVVVPDSVTILDVGALSYDNNLSEITLSSNLINIGWNAISSNDALTELTIPASVCIIDSYAVSGCYALKKIVFEGACPLIGPEVFVMLSDDVVIYVPDDQIEEYKKVFEENNKNLNIQPSGKPAVLYSAEDYLDTENLTFDAETGSITGYNGMNTRLTIPESIDGVPVKAIGKRALWEDPLLGYVTLPEGLEYVGEDAFSITDTLKYVEFPSTLKTIDKKGFSSYRGFRLDLPDSLEYIGEEAFSYFSVETDLIIPEGVKKLGPGAFSAASRLQRVFLPSSLEKIGDNCFSRSPITYVYMEGLELPEISDTAFDKCEYLRDIDLNEKCTKQQMLDVQALVDAQGLECRVWRNQNTEVEYARFSVEELPDDPSKLYLTGYEKEAAKVRSYDTYTIGEEDKGVVGIADGALKGDQTITYFAVPHNDEFVYVGKEAFADSIVEHVDLFDSVTSIGAEAFRNCAQLKEITIPASVTEIGSRAFAGTSLSEFVIPANIPVNGEALEGIELSNIRLSADATDEQVAEWSAALNYPWYDRICRVGEESMLVKMPYEPLPEDNFEFDEESRTITAYVGTAVDVIIPRTIGGVPVENISYNAFENTRDYVHSDMETNQKEGDWVPMRCVILPETLKSIEDSAFTNCHDLETVICYAPLETTNKGLFSECQGLKKVVFVNGVLHMDNYLFNFCKNLETVWCKNQVDRIGIQTFGVTPMERLCVNAKNIDVSAFAGMESLKEIHIRGGVEHMSLGAFAMLPSIETICLEGIDPDVMEDDWANLGNSNLTILVPEDTSDEQLEAIGRKFLSSMIITDGAQVKRGTCSMPEDPMPDIAEMLSAYGI
ncbi:leucine-rich repeat domain-containing protein [Blautia obeum]|uniref:leucine-rich repeat domain-containing protein n=1 Tax=Blautia obeum TaxID=40520 RepID=UPI00210E3ECE|nr:leucine-rich repeat domain-containing protein [Blautia obeum]MCQ4790765.1 leucine-rich repeat domain-containing protein [Blautia obeum]